MSFPECEHKQTLSMRAGQTRKKWSPHPHPSRARWRKKSGKACHQHHDHHQLVRKSGFAHKAAAAAFFATFPFSFFFLTFLWFFFSFRFFIDDVMTATLCECNRREKVSEWGQIGGEPPHNPHLFRRTGRRRKIINHENSRVWRLPRGCYQRFIFGFIVPKRMDGNSGFVGSHKMHEKITSVFL